MSRRCLICSNLNPCREHSEQAQDAELARNSRAARGLQATTPVAQGDEVRGARTEYGWLIERDSRDGLRYATPRSWTVDHMKALRFARKIDAGAFAASRQDWSTDIRITEHAWD